jgi:DNA-directed RNA polymerase specialized sigma24 family protein
MGDTGGGTVSDRELVEAAGAGDRQALVAVYERWADPLYNHCFYLRLRREDEARDLTQRSLVIAVRTLGQLREPERFAGWLFAVAHHEAGRMMPAHAAWEPGPGPGPGPGADPDDADSEAEAVAEVEALGRAATPAGMVMDAELRWELWQLVWRAAAGLAQVDRELLNLSYREGFRPPGLGLITGLEPPLVRRRLARVQEQLERTLGALLVARLAGQGGADGGGDAGGQPLGGQLGAPCAQLAALLAHWDGRFTGEVRQGVSRHLDRCETCTARRRLLVTPEVLLPPPVPVPWHARDRILSRLRLAAAGGGVSVPAGPAPAPAVPGGRPRHDRRAARGWSPPPAPPGPSPAPAPPPAASVPPVAATRAAARLPGPRPAGPGRPRRLVRWLRGHAKVVVLAVLLVLMVWLGGWLALRGQPSPFAPDGGAGSQPPSGHGSAQASVHGAAAPVDVAPT